MIYEFYSPINSTRYLVVFLIFMKLKIKEAVPWMIKFWYTGQRVTDCMLESLRVKADDCS